MSAMVDSIILALIGQRPIGRQSCWLEMASGQPILRQLKGNRLSSWKLQATSAFVLPRYCLWQ